MVIFCFMFVGIDDKGEDGFDEGCEGEEDWVWGWVTYDGSDVGGDGGEGFVVEDEEDAWVEGGLPVVRERTS